MDMDSQTNISSSPECRYVSSHALILTWLTLYLLILPLFLVVLHVGYGRMKKRSSLSHSDVFTFHIIIMEGLTITGTGVFLAADQAWIQVDVGNHLYNIAMTGQMFIHTLTCVERYLAVVHPITYLRLKKRGGVRIRNVCIAATWILSVGLRSLFKVVKDEDFDVIFNTSLAFSVFAVVSFCSVSVLCALIGPGPGGGGRDLRRIDQSKQKAFSAITVISGVLLLRLVAFLVEYLLGMMRVLDDYNRCLMIMSLSLLNFPSSLVLPLMFLQKSRRLPVCLIRNCFSKTNACLFTD